MKKLVQINVVCNGSTGRIMCDIAKEASDFESFCFFGRGKPNKELNCIKIDNKLEVYFHVFLTRVFNKHGHGSYFATKRMIKKLKKINPDVIHMHNIHGYYLNLKLLFNYLKNDYKGKTIWTLHDCWPFTGHCSHFTIVKCNKWKKVCGNCPQVKEYPKALILDTSKEEFLFKKELFTNVNNLTIVTPSKWLANLVKKSFLKKYNVEVINNGIDLNVFKPTYDESIYNKYSIPRDKKIILGVASIWTEKKGLNDFIKLAKFISNEYVIVLVGKLLKKGIFPSNIIHINRTDDAVELAKIYTIAHVFFNPSHEETFSLTIAEAKNCGLESIVFDTSAPKEITNKNDCVIKKAMYKKGDDIFNEMKKYIEELKHDKIKLTKKYDKSSMIDEYVFLYR